MIEKSNKVSICANIASFAVYLISSYLWQHNTYQFWSRKCVGYHELRSPFSLAQSPKSLQLHQVNSESSQQVEPLTNSTNPTPQNNFSLTFQPWKNKISRISDNLWYKLSEDEEEEEYWWKGQSFILCLIYLFYEYFKFLFMGLANFACYSWEGIQLYTL